MKGSAIDAVCSPNAIVSRVACSACLENTARYVAFHDGLFALTCGVCPIKYGWESVRLTDLGVLLEIVSTMVRSSGITVKTIPELRSILGRHP